MNEQQKIPPFINFNINFNVSKLMLDSFLKAHKIQKYDFVN